MKDTFSIDIWVYEVNPSGMPLRRLVNELTSEFSAVRASKDEKETKVHIKLDDFERFCLKYVEKKYYFNWLPIFQNDNNIWTEQRLVNLQNHLKKLDTSAWYCICRRKDIQWSEKLIEKLSANLDFKTLSGNTTVPWTEQIIDKWFDRWDWANLSGNKSLPWSATFLSRYESKWKWKPDYPQHAYHCHQSNFHYSYPSISTNSSIFWDVPLFEKYHEKLDYWLLAKTGKLVDEIFIQYCELFQIKQICGFRHFRYSDWRRSEDVLQTALEQYPYNENFHLTDKLMDFATHKKITVTKNSKDYDDDMQEVETLLSDVWKRKI